MDNAIQASCNQPLERILSFADENCEFLLKLADEYQMDKVKKLCIDYMESALDDENCLHFCRVAEDFNLGTIQDETPKKRDEDDSDDDDEEVSFIDKCVEEAKWLPLSMLEESSYLPLVTPTPASIELKILQEKVKILEAAKRSMLPIFFQSLN